MEKFFKLKENGTTVGREIVAGLTTFFAMAYIIVVNPNTLSGRAGGLEEELMPWAPCSWPLSSPLSSAPW